MRLTLKTVYGIRALMEMAYQHDKQLTICKTIAKKQNISQKFLEQILSALTASGLVKTARGRHGGCSLAQKPDRVRLSEICAALETPSETAQCNQHTEFVTGCAGCVIHAVFSELLRRKSEILESLTLKDMLDIAEGLKTDIN